MRLKHIILPIIFASILFVFFDQRLIYIPLIITALFMAYDVVNLCMYGLPYIPRLVLIKNQDNTNCPMIQKQKLNLGGGNDYINNNENENSRTLREKYLDRLQQNRVSDNTWISTSSVVNPDDRLYQSDMIRNVNEFRQPTGPLASHPDIDTESTSNLNIDRNVGGFRMGNSYGAGNMLRAQNEGMKNWYLDNTAIQRQEMANAANFKVSQKMAMRNEFPIHTMSGLMGYR